MLTNVESKCSPRTVAGKDLDSAKYSLAEQPLNLVSSFASEDVSWAISWALILCDQLRH